jgi:hypothetical protein
MRLCLAFVVCGMVGLAGCSGGVLGGATQTGDSVSGARLAGSVHGGQQPIVGARVYLFAANTTGYGGAGIAASSSNASMSLLTSGAGTMQDTTSTDPTYLDYYTSTVSVLSWPLLWVGVRVMYPHSVMWIHSYEATG